MRAARQSQSRCEGPDQSGDGTVHLVPREHGVHADQRGGNTHVLDLRQWSWRGRARSEREPCVCSAHERVAARPSAQPASPCGRNEWDTADGPGRQGRLMSTSTSDGASGSICTNAVASPELDGEPLPNGMRVRRTRRSAAWAVLASDHERSALRSADSGARRPRLDRPVTRCRARSRRTGPPRRRGSRDQAMSSPAGGTAKEAPKFEICRRYWRP